MANTSLVISTTSPTVFGQAVAVNATLSVTAPGSGTPTGSISVTGTGGAACTITLPATSCNLGFTSTGAKTINASYGGDTNFNGSTASSIGHTVNKANTSLLISTTSPTVFGQAVAVNATLSVTAPGAGTPTGSISVTGTGGAACTITLPATSCNLTFTSTGGKTVNASYGGDGSFNGSTASGISHTVNKASTTLSIDDPVDPSVVGQSVAVNATLAVTAPGAGTPNGSITVTGSGTAGCTITLPATSCNAIFTAAGPQNLNASYGGDTNFNGSAASAIGHAVNAAATTLLISDSPDPSSVGEMVMISAILGVAAPGAGIPSGQITVTGTSTTGCNIVLPATSCQLSFSAVGAKTINASYGGDANFSISSATPIAHTVVSGADLAVTKTDHVTAAVPGTIVSYDIVVTNVGTVGVALATLTDTLPAILTGVSWTCTPTPPAACANASGAGTINEFVTLSPGESLTYTLTGTVGGVPGNLLTNTATITAPTGVTDVNPANDSAIDTDQVVANKVFEDSFEDPIL
jgi:uncharacterized repeat protein (TIGR01451 family)